MYPSEENDSNTFEKMKGSKEICGWLFSLELVLNRFFVLIFRRVMQWTTDVDLANALVNAGVKDLKAVRFFENRANGQSKGYVLRKFNHAKR